MTHEELLAKIDLCFEDIPDDYGQIEAQNALRAVVELHKPMAVYKELCRCETIYPCETIQAISQQVSK